MSERTPTPDESGGQGQTTGSAEPSTFDRWLDTGRQVAIWLVALLVVGLIAAAVLPRWWAQRLGGLAGGKLTTGSIIGIVFGVVFTLVPLILITAAIRRREKSKHPWWYLVAALIFAIPNLATLWIQVGGGGGAKAGRRVLDVEAPGVRGGTLIGAILAVAGYAALEYVLISRARAKKAAADRPDPPSKAARAAT